MLMIDCQHKNAIAFLELPGESDAGNVWWALDRFNRAWGSDEGWSTVIDHTRDYVREGKNAGFAAPL